MFLTIRFRVRVDDYDYMVYATSSVMKCLGCGEEGHIVRVCPKHWGPTAAGPVAPVPVPPHNVTAAIPDPQVVSMSVSVVGEV